MSSSNFGTFARSKTRKFPPQAIDEILSFVHDLDTLKSCTLVCRDWESTAQLYLFSVVHVGGHPPPRRHNPYDIPHPLIPLNELHTFRLQGFIRELRILQSPGNAFLQQLQVILDNGDFRRLKTVMLDQTSLTMTGATMAQVQKLLLSNIRFSGPNGLLALDLSRFSSLEDLLFEGITFLPSTLGPPVNTPPPLQLKTLVIQSCANDVYATLIDTLLLDQSPVNIKHLSRFDNHDNQLIYIADPLDPNARIPCPDTLSMASRAVGHLLKENNVVQHIGLHNVPGQTELLTPTFLCGLRSLVVPMKTLQLKESLQNLCNLLTESKPSASGPLTLILKYPYFTADILRCGHEWIFLDNLAGSHVVKLGGFYGVSGRCFFGGGDLASRWAATI
ncbi:uncharacterized protein EV420DRAFT_1151186 [Desarmillaria tabescens]|uniref:F-box domain-containing protein n=1 Tax=Armillaria tabescens TaxID=1929756 RepID=A0AA39TL78_ARMTA|nr:uncharacterized protein EV420DRAFT_1151186 [Desarmillaria tabescens]KAK0463032.1 hypothetical protein EV420DRAFT_1151186 [Desarmillaria tabescens]